MNVYESRTIRLLKEKFEDVIEQQRTSLETATSLEAIAVCQGYIRGLRAAIKLADDTQADINEGG